MKPFFAAIRFLTIAPVPARLCGGEPELGRGVVFFPAVGLLIGAAGAALAWGLSAALPPWPGAALLVTYLLFASGGLHVDGLADAADGFLSSRAPEQALAIMRDSRSGGMAVVAVVVVFAIKVLSLGSLPVGLWWGALVLAPLAGRCALVWSLFLLPYARPEGGLASVFYRRRPMAGSALATVLAAGVGWWALGAAGLLAAGAALALTLLWSAWCRRRIGGGTGDTLGAACEMGEAAVLLTLAACAHGGLL